MAGIPGAEERLMSEEDDVITFSGGSLQDLQAFAREQLAASRPPDGTPSRSETPTPFAIICRDHGRQYLTRDGYDRQMSDPDARWACPVDDCGRISSWDDDVYEAACERDDPMLHGEDCEPDCSCRTKDAAP